MNEIQELQNEIVNLYKDDSIRANFSDEEMNSFAELVSEDVGRMPWIQLVSLRGGKQRIYRSLLGNLIQAKRTVGIDPITFFIILKLIIQILILLRKEFGSENVNT